MMQSSNLTKTCILSYSLTSFAMPFIAFLLAFEIIFVSVFLVLVSCAVVNTRVYFYEVLHVLSPVLIICR